MYSPKRFASRVGSIGQKLPDPYRILGRESVHCRRGTTNMIAGVPGSYKSVLALNMMAEWAKHGVTALYFSADGDEYTVVRRLAGILSGDDQGTVESKLLRDKNSYTEALARLEGIEFEYERFEFEELVIRVKSYEAVYGAFPDVIVIDNLANFAASPYAFDEMQTFMVELDGLAKETKSHVLILHHAKLDIRNPNARNPLPPDQPPADYMIQGKMTQFPSVALTMRANGMNLSVACVKNRNGRPYPDADRWLSFAVLPSMGVREVGR